MPVSASSSPHWGESGAGGGAPTAGAASGSGKPSGAPVAELFLPGTRPRPHRLRDLSMLALALIIIAAAGTQLLGQRPASAAQGRA